MQVATQQGLVCCVLTGRHGRAVAELNTQLHVTHTLPWPVWPEPPPSSVAPPSPRWGPCGAPTASLSDGHDCPWPHRGARETRSFETPYCVQFWDLVHCVNTLSSENSQGTFVFGRNSRRELIPAKLLMVHGSPFDAVGESLVLSFCLILAAASLASVQTPRRASWERPVRAFLTFLVYSAEFPYFKNLCVF